MAAAATKNYNIEVNVTIKRTRDEVEFAAKENEKLYNLISTDKEVPWAKQQIEKIQEMVLLPDAKQIRQSIINELAKSNGVSTPESED